MAKHAGRPYSNFLPQLALAVAIASGVAVSEARTLIQNKGSDTLVNVAQAWAEEYRKVDPDVAVAVTGGGSGTGIAAMINGTVDIANASRKMKDKEMKMAKDRGQDPLEHVVGYDALAVFVHQNNPMDEISIGQLAEIYGEEGATENWGDLGIEVPGCQGQEMVLVSRQNNSGTYAYFRKAVLGKARDYKLGTRDMHGSKDVVDLVEKTPCAIGYSGLAYATDHIKMPCVTNGRWPGLCETDCGQRQRRQLPDRPTAVDVHQWRATGCGQGLSRLDPQRCRPVHHPAKKDMPRYATSSATDTGIRQTIRSSTPGNTGCQINPSGQMKGTDNGAL